MRTSARFTVLLTTLAALALPVVPAYAQSTGFVTGFPGKDPAGDDEIGWGPAYRPETSFSQPGTPPTPGDFAGAAYRARTGRGPYDAIQGRGDRPVGYAPDAEMRPALRDRHRRHRIVRRHSSRQAHSSR